MQRSYDATENGDLTLRASADLCKPKAESNQ